MCWGIELTSDDDAVCVLHTAEERHQGLLPRRHAAKYASLQGGWGSQGTLVPVIVIFAEVWSW